MNSRTIISMLKNESTNRVFQKYLEKKNPIPEQNMKFINNLMILSRTPKGNSRIENWLMNGNTKQWYNCLHKAIITISKLMYWQKSADVDKRFSYTGCWES